MPATETVRPTTAGVRSHSVKLTGAALLLHLVVSILHATPHLGVPIVQSDALTAVILLAVYVLPVVGFALFVRGNARLGLGLFTASMALSFGLGAFLHFLVPNPDHVLSVPAGPWQLPFQVTAVAVGVVDAAGVVVGAVLWRDLGGRGSDGLAGSGRIAGVPDSGFRPLVRLFYWFSRRRIDEVLEPLSITAHHRGVLLGYGGFELALDNSNRVDDRLKELAVLRVATRIGCAFCIDIGSAEGRSSGVTDQQLRTLHSFEESDAFSERERLVLRYADGMTSAATGVSGELFDALAAEFDEAELVELTAAVAFENYRGRFNHAFGVDAQGFSEGEFCPAPEVAAAGD
jgi:AhpD family alkylhydroperoxidase